MRTVSCAVAGTTKQTATARPNAAGRTERNAVMLPPKSAFQVGAAIHMPSHPLLSRPLPPPFAATARSIGSHIAGRLDQIASVAVAIQLHARPQGFEFAYDFAAVAASHCGHELLEVFRPIGKRGRNRGEALAFETRRLRDA